MSRVTDKDREAAKVWLVGRQLQGRALTEPLAEAIATARAEGRREAFEDEDDAEVVVLPGPLAQLLWSEPSFPKSHIISGKCRVIIIHEEE